MKYLLFTIAALGIIPMAVAMLADRRMMRLAVAGMILPVLCFNQSAINFFSHELYRGTSRGLEVSVVYLVAAALVAAMLVGRGKVQFLPDTGTKIYLVYFLMSLPSLANAENHLFSIFELWKMLMLALVFVAIYNYLRNTGDFQVVMYTLGVVVIFCFLSVVKQHIFGIHQARGPFPHQNSLAMYMAVAGTMLMARVLNRNESYRSVFFMGAFLCASAALLRTYSRGAIFCYPIGLAITIGSSLLLAFRPRMMMMLLPLVAAGLCGVMLLIPKIVQRFQNAPESSANMRIDFAIAARNMVQDHPWAGVGINNWGIKINPPYNYSEHRDPERGFTEDYKDGIVESIYLLVMAECGLPCLALLLWWFGWYWFKALTLMVKLRRTQHFWVAAGALGGLTCVYLQSTLEWVLKQQINFIQLTLIFAMISAVNAMHKEQLRSTANLSRTAAPLHP